MTELHYASIADLAPRVQAGDISPVELTTTMLDRIDAVDGRLECYADVMADQALADARAAEQAIAAGSHLGPLHGVPVAVKDLCDMAGSVTAAGTTVLSDNVATEDSRVVHRLREAGAVVLGKLNLTEGATAGYHPDRGVPVNPWNPERWAGVSSSGSGAATAAGLCFGSLGSDTGGSIRLPAAANGVVGLKPTYGRVSRAGVFPLGETLDHIGPLARTSVDAAIMLGAIAGPDPADPTSVGAPVDDYAGEAGAGVAGLRIGYDAAWTGDGAGPETVAAIEAVLARLESAGAEIAAVDMPIIDEAHWYTIVTAELACAHADTYPSRADEYGPFLGGILGHVGEITGADVAAAQIERGRFNGRLRSLFERVDVIASPAMRRAAFEAPRAALRGSFEQVNALAPDVDFRFTVPHNLSGSPTITLPSGFDDDGMPLAVQFAGRHLEEGVLVRVGHAVEQLTDHHTKHPAI